uniref:HTH psq-type domain-containing protein n=1 Tax=Daphnia galeata TaxID=27404 RepID=A0A8J2W3T9_9CRUS|nr:unnamed protein product [Daphnia galeata]
MHMLSGSSDQHSKRAENTYQYQLQALWQKAWATGQGVMQNLRFRERGPFKTWRPETMAEAIMAVLREGLSLSQAARKFDIPYPTFVLYANRVNNMLGPSADGGPELRPKGRGRPQRILTGSWPEDHVHGVIRAVVFRDPSSLPRHIDREDASKLTANRSSGSSMSRLLTVHPAHQQSIQGELGGGSGSGMRGLIHTAMNNGNSHNYNHEFALPSSSNTTGTFTHGGSLLSGGSAYPSMRSTAGPSSAINNAANGLMADLMAANGSAGHTNGSNNNNNNNMQGGSGSSSGCLSGSSLTSSSLFNALQQEVAEETRLAALNAMTQRLMTSLEGTSRFHHAGNGRCLTSGRDPGDNFGLGVSCNQQRGAGGIQNPAAAAAAAAAALEAAAWFGPSSSFTGQLPIVDLAADDVTVAEDDEGDDEDDDAVQHLASFSAHHNPAVTNPVPPKQQEQLFGE